MTLLRHGTGRIAVALSLLVLTVVSLGPAGAGLPDGACWEYRLAEKKFAKLTNEARSADGLVRLKLDPELSRVARKHTSDMVATGQLFHTPPEVLGALVTRWRKLGENVGTGDTVAALQAAFMASQTHRDNILKPGYRFIGVGTKRADGKLWVTVIFESRRNPGTTLPMPDC